MQTLGVAARRHIGDSVWIGPVLADMRQDKNYVISDVRFENEAYMVKALGGEIWRVQRPDVEPVNNHISERALADYSADRTILNTGTKEDLEVLVKLRLDSYLAYKNN
jgi:Neuraminidase (sialidase)